MCNHCNIRGWGFENFFLKYSRNFFIPYLTQADLLLFHRRLRSLVAVELKIGEFEAEYAGKMQLYLTALDEQVKLPDENPSIGIIICKSKDKTYVEYALKRSNVPIGVATYQLRSSLPEDMKEMLPEPEEIAERLKIFEKG